MNTELTPEQRKTRAAHLGAVALAMALRTHEVSTIPLFYQLTREWRVYK